MGQPTKIGPKQPTPEIGPKRPRPKRPDRKRIGRKRPGVRTGIGPKRPVTGQKGPWTKRTMFQDKTDQA